MPLLCTQLEKQPGPVQIGETKQHLFKLQGKIPSDCSIVIQTFQKASSKRRDH